MIPRIDLWVFFLKTPFSLISHHNSLSNLTKFQKISWKYLNSLWIRLVFTIIALNSLLIPQIGKFGIIFDAIPREIDDLAVSSRQTSPSLSSFLLSPALSLFISSSACSLSFSPCFFRFLARWKFSARKLFLSPLSFSLSSFSFLLLPHFSLLTRRLWRLPPPFFVYRVEDSYSFRCSSRSRERGKKRDERERDRKFLSIRRLCRSDAQFDRSNFDRSGLTEILKERGHQINGQKCCKLKSRYLSIVMDLWAKISWAWLSFQAPRICWGWLKFWDEKIRVMKGLLYAYSIG